jgi:hypothetical protein
MVIGDWGRSYLCPSPQSPIPSPLISFLELKNFLQRNAENAGDTKGNFQRRRILVPLNGVDRLPCDADLIRKCLLCHLAMLKTELADVNYFLHSAVCSFLAE